MNKIETKILNCSAVREAEKNMVFAARLTQRGHMIHSMDDLVKLYEKSFLDETVKTLGQLPHPAIPEAWHSLRRRARSLLCTAGHSSRGLTGSCLHKASVSLGKLSVFHKELQILLRRNNCCTAGRHS